MQGDKSQGRSGCRPNSLLCEKNQHGFHVLVHTEPLFEKAHKKLVTAVASREDSGRLGMR